MKTINKVFIRIKQKWNASRHQQKAKIKISKVYCCTNLISDMKKYCLKTSCKLNIYNVNPGETMSTFIRRAIALTNYGNKMELHLYNLFIYIFICLRYIYYIYIYLK